MDYAATIDENLGELKKIRSSEVSDSEADLKQDVTNSKLLEKLKSGFSKERMGAAMSSAKVKMAGAAGLAAAGGYYAGKGVAKTVALPFKGAAALGRGAVNVGGAVAERMKPFWPAYLFIIFGIGDYVLKLNYGHSQFTAIVDIVLAIAAFGIYRNFYVVIPAFLEIVYPRYIAINYGWWNTLPFWAAFGVILFAMELPEMDLSGGDAFLTALTVFGAILFFVGPNLGFNDLMAQQVTTGPLESVGDFVSERSETGWFRWGGVIGEFTDCAVPDWMGGKNNCTAIQRRVDPTYSETMNSKDYDDIAPVKYSSSLKDTLDPEYYTDEEINLLGSFSITSEEYPIVGSYSWKLGDKIGNSTPKYFATSVSGGANTVPETLILGEWPENSFTEPGTYTAEFTAYFSIITEAEYRTWLAPLNPELPKDYYYENYAFLGENRVPKSYAVKGPVELSLGLGQPEAPIMIDEPGKGFEPILFMKLKDANEGSRREKLRSISYVGVLGGDWFSLNKADGGCGDFTDNSGTWVLNAEKLATINRKLVDQAESPIISCKMHLNRENMFQNNVLEPMEVNMRALIIYEYEVKRTADVEIKSVDDSSISESVSLYTCNEGILFKEGNLSQKHVMEAIWNASLKYRVPYIVALSVAQTESGIRQYNSGGKTIESPKREDGSADIGVMQINTKYHLDKISLNELSCSYKKNVDYGVKYLATLKNNPKGGYWEKVLNAYNSGKFVWAKSAETQPDDYKIAIDGPNYPQWDIPKRPQSYSDAVEGNCTSITDNGWTAADCQACIRTNSILACNLGTHPNPPQQNT